MTTSTFSNKIDVAKIGNKEILEKLLDLKAFPAGVRSVKDYSLALILDTDGNELGVYAVKKGADPVPLRDFLTVDLVARVNSESGKITDTLVEETGKDDKKTTVDNSTFKLVGVAGLLFDEGEADDAPVIAQAAGAVTGSGKYAQDTSKPASAGAIASDDGLTTIQSLSGSGWAGSDGIGADASIFQGSVRVGAGAKIDLKD